MMRLRRCCRSDPQSPLHWFTLTFRNRKTEEEFLRHGLEGVRSFLLRCSLVFLCIWIVVLLLSQVWLWDKHPDIEESYPQSHIDRFIIVVGVGLIQIFTVAFVQVTKCFEKIHPMVFEVSAAAYAMVVIVVVVATAPGHLAQARGHRSTSIDEDDREADFLLTLAIVSLFVNLNTHIRWHIILPVQVCCVLAYLVPALLFKENRTVGRVLIHAAELGTLVTIGSVAKRTIQMQQRENLLLVIQERTRRFSSEFQLSQREFQLSQLKESTSGRTLDQHADARSAHESVPASVPTTTETGKAFNINSMQALEAALEGIREIGKKEQWLLDPRDISWSADSMLGVGGFGIVVQGHYEGIDVAVKVPKTAPTAASNMMALLELCNELQILRRLRHPNIVSFYGAWLDVDSSDLALVLELVEGVTLRAFIANNIGELEKARILCNIACALVYLHTRHPQVVHGDLKDTNIYVETDSQNGQSSAKLLDFGLSRRVTRRARPLGGSLLWMAPEVAQRAGAPSTPSDVFSFGRVAYFCVTGTVMGDKKGRNALVRDLKRGIVQPLAWPAGPFAGAYKDIVDSCNHTAPTLRPDMREVHKSMVTVWEWCGGEPDVPHAPMGGDLQSELRTLRRAAIEWRARTAGAPSPLPRRASEPGAEEAPGKPRSAPPGAAAGEGGGGGAAPAEAARLYPEHEVTPPTTQALLLTGALVRTNFELLPTACCKFHAALRNLRATVGVLEQQRCSRHGGEPVGQCGECKAILTQDDVDGEASESAATTAAAPRTQQECDVCGETISFARPARPSQSEGGQ